MEITQENVNITEQVVIDWLKTRPWGVGLLGGYVDLWHDTDDQFEQFAHWFTRAMFDVIRFTSDEDSNVVGAVAVDQGQDGES